MIVAWVMSRVVEVGKIHNKEMETRPTRRLVRTPALQKGKGNGLPGGSFRYQQKERPSCLLSPLEYTSFAWHLRCTHLVLAYRCSFSNLHRRRPCVTTSSFFSSHRIYAYPRLSSLPPHHTIRHDIDQGSKGKVLDPKVLEKVQLEQEQNFVLSVLP